MLVGMGAQSPEWIATARLVRRSGFGATGVAVDAAVKLGAGPYIVSLLAAAPTSDPGGGRDAGSGFRADPGVGQGRVESADAGP